ncbi:MAG: hypothetical protein CME70_16880 [Halobacteriovorax sp.]|nr:hypothetical protein [Halobacteriovorax sp.]|tara:strand:- start:151617 stop:151886 length:270 start_codon:yes stop_codon:yes gene_type:complete
MKVLIFLLFLSACASRPPCKGLTYNCNNGDGGACYKLGTAIFSTLGKENKNPELTKTKAANWMKKGCDLGHDKSCFEYTQYQKYKLTNP